MEIGSIGYMVLPRKTKGEMLDAIKTPVVKSRMVARNTIEYETDIGDVVTRLHDTDIVRTRPEGTVYLDTGGWNTKTTRARINEALPRGISVHTHSGQTYIKTFRNAYPFTQTVRIGPRGGVTTDIQSGEAASYDSVRALVDRYISRLKRDGIPTESGGDPWIIPDSKSGKYSEDIMRAWLNDPDTKEPYIFLTFIYRALKWSGRTDFGIQIQIEGFAKESARTRAYLCGTVRRYIRACLGYASS